MTQLIILAVLSIALLFYFTELVARVVIVAVLAFIIWFYYNNYFESFINTRPDVGPQGPSPFKGFFNEPSKFINFDLTDKPRGNNGPYPIYWWWKNAYNDLQNQQYKDCDQYRCQTQALNGYTAKPGFNLNKGMYTDPTLQMQSVDDLNFGGDCGYYENPIEFCNRYPEYELCPNHWISDRHPVKSQKQCDLYTVLPWQKVPY